MIESAIECSSCTASGNCRCRSKNRLAPIDFVNRSIQLIMVNRVCWIELAKMLKTDYSYGFNKYFVQLTCNDMKPKSSSQRYSRSKSKEHRCLDLLPKKCSRHKKSL